MNKIRNDDVCITTDNGSQQTITKKLYGKLDNIGKMNKIFKIHSLKRLNYEETEKLHRPIMSKEIKNSPIKEKLGT